MNNSGYKKGDNVESVRSGRTGIITSTPEYHVMGKSGLYYTNIKWNDGSTSMHFCVSKHDLKKISPSTYEVEYGLGKVLEDMEK